MPRTFSATSDAPVSAVWSLVAEPARWAEWATHVRGAWGLGSPEVETGRLGAVRLFGFMPVPAKIVAKRDGRWWTWQVGPLTLVHAVSPLGTGSLISMTIRA